MIMPSRYAPRQTFTTGDDSWSVVLEALLIGHEDWVHSLAWQPNLSPGQRPCLLSAAMDRTMMLWRPDKSTGAMLLACQSAPMKCRCNTLPAALCSSQLHGVELGTCL